MELKDIFANIGQPALLKCNDGFEALVTLRNGKQSYGITRALVAQDVAHGTIEKWVDANRLRLVVVK